MAYSKVQRECLRLVPEAKGKPFTNAVGALAIRRGADVELFRRTGTIGPLVCATGNVTQLGRPWTDEELLAEIGKA